MRRTVRAAARPEHAILGGLLRAKREAAGLSQRDVARALDRTQAFVWKVEQGVQHVDVATLIDYARLVGVSAADLVREVEGRETRG